MTITKNTTTIDQTLFLQHAECMVLTCIVSVQLTLVFYYNIIIRFIVSSILEGVFNKTSPCSHKVHVETM